MGVKDIAALAELMVETPIGGVVVMLCLFITGLLSGYLPTPREYNRAVKDIKELKQQVEKKDHESHEAHERLDRVTDILIPTLQSIERRLDHFTPPERHRPPNLPWEGR